MMPDIKIENFFFCESIRQEVDSKFALSGVFAGDIHVRSTPATILLALFLQIVNEGTGDFDGEIRVVAPGGEVPIRGKMRASFKANGKSGIPIGPFPILVNEPGQIRFEWTFGENRWDTLAEIGVVLSDTAPTGVRDVFLPVAVATGPVP